MLLSTFISLSIIGIIAFTLSKKKIHHFELILSFLAIEFIISTYIAVVNTNYSYIEISTKTQDYVTHQIFEIVLLPVLMFLTINSSEFFKSFYIKGLLGVTLVGVLCSIEYSLLKLNIIEYKGWHIVYSFIAYGLIYIVIQAARYSFRKILIKEGMIKHDSP
ncbi:hypothetical protein SAMN05877753_109148 [Bacillus oleivorans]|uniref:Uncharacterized protein n=1 Tax=Bacillus oleivorans TaxID=1448271 RepID=A0A285D481_9BACI|nr:hypothetical protein [Bacillus oleivorans]SNX74495.1 hypothetical protein SAMN05877753_109148 [Bacillus oleivorans]